MIEGIRIESEEDGWHLILEGDLDALMTKWTLATASEPYRLDLPMGQDAALQLCREILPVQEWRAEGDQVRREFESRLAAGGDLDDPDAIPDDPDHPDPEILREAADLSRKAERERA